MNRHYYIYDETLSEDEKKAQEEWNEYVKMVDENDRKTKRENTIFAVVFCIIIVLIMFFVFFGKMLKSAFI